MKVTITSIELKGFMKFFALSKQALAITRQLKGTNYVKFKKQGFWTKHYTMTLWNTEGDLKEFARSGAHMEAMKTTKEIAKTVQTYTYDADDLPDWKTAKNLLKLGKTLHFE